MIKALSYYGPFAMEWYFCVLFCFLGLYGVLMMKSSFRRLASLVLMFSSMLPALIICGKFTEDMHTTQAMAVSLIFLQVLITTTGLAVIRKTIPLKLFRNIKQKENEKEN
jgi:NADH:ubiquinone oxidoreductase subunit K